MGNLFNLVMRGISTLIGLLMVAMGCVWILQGLNIAFLHSFMAGELKWAFYGATLAAVGVCQIVWSQRRRQ
jgi:hypothetical protein